MDLNRDDELLYKVVSDVYAERVRNGIGQAKLTEQVLRFENLHDRVMRKCGNLCASAAKEPKRYRACVKRMFQNETRLWHSWWL